MPLSGLKWQSNLDVLWPVCGCRGRLQGVTLRPPLGAACWGGGTARNCSELGSEMLPPSRRTGLLAKFLLRGRSTKACTAREVGLETTEQDLILQATRKAPRLRQPGQPVTDGERPVTLLVRASLLLSIYLLDSILSESTFEFNFLRF